MKNQYVGDVNDYLKYALLRALASSSLSLAVVWMLTAPDDRRDGQRLRYLSQPTRFRQLDPTLFDALREITSRERSVNAIEAARILPEAVYVREVLNDDLIIRQRYFEQVGRALVGRSLVFLDPDNGFAVRSVAKGKRDSSKYLYWDEAVRVYRSGCSLVVYQHFPRRKRTEFFCELAERACQLTGCHRVLALTTSHVMFVVMPQPSDEPELSERLCAFADQTVLNLHVFVSEESV